MAGSGSRVLGLLALLVFVAGKGTKRGGENENGRKVEVLEAKNFGGEIPNWTEKVVRREANTIPRREDEKDKSAKVSMKKRASWKVERRSQLKRMKRNGKKETKAMKSKKKRDFKKKTKQFGGNAPKKEPKKNSKWKNRKGTKKKKTHDKNVKRTNNPMGKKAKKSKKIIARECLSTTCVDNAVKIMKLLKDRLSFYETKFRRISKKSQIGLSKSSKNSVFQPALARLIDSGGGNGSALACGGNSSNAGAKRMTNLTEVLEECDVNVKAACDPSGFPLPNMTEVNACLDNGAIITDMSNNCTKLSGSPACSCWEGNSETEAAVKMLKTCDLTPSTKAVTEAMNKCKDVFGKCRKYEDAVAEIIHACNQNPAAMKKRLKNLSQNKKAVEEVLERIGEVSSTRFRRRSVTSGSEFLSISRQIVLLVGQNPVSNNIFILSTSLVNSANVVFSPEELVDLSSTEKSLSNSVGVLAQEIALSSARITSNFFCCRGCMSCLHKISGFF